MFNYDVDFGAYDELGEEFEMGAAQRGGRMRRPSGRGGRGGQRGQGGQGGRGLQRRQGQGLQRGRRSAPQKSSTETWQKTVLQGVSALLTAAGPFVINIRPQFDFVAQDFAMDGTTAGSNVTSILFGDHVVFQNAVGVPVATVNSTSFIRGLVKGAKITGGLDIIVNGNITAVGGQAFCTVVGLKPATTCY